MRQGIFSISVSSRMCNSPFFATTCGARQTAANPGRCCLAREARAAATSNGSPSIRPLARGMASNTSQTTALTVAAAACNFNVLPTAGSPGRRQSLFPMGPVYGTLDVDTNGNLFIGGEGNTFYCVRSSNAQNGGVTPTFDRVTAVNLGGAIVSGGINPAGLCGQAFLAVDRSGGPTNNNIYMLASVRPTGFSTGTDVMFARSTNGGQSFSAPIRINDDPVNHNKYHWFGTLSVAPNGRIDSVWLDTRNAANNTDSQLFYSCSTDGGVTWAPNVAVSNSFNPFEGYPNQNKIGDYITIVSG